MIASTSERQPTLAEWRKLWQGYDQHGRSDRWRFMPLAAKVKLSESEWLSIFENAALRSPFRVLLESGRAGRYSVLAYGPTHRLHGKGTLLSIEQLDRRGQVLQRIHKRGALLESLREWMDERKAPSQAGLPDFCGGLLGYFSYDLVRQIERLPEQSKDDVRIPDADFFAFDRLLVHDLQAELYWAVVYTPAPQNKQQADDSYAAGKNKLHEWIQEVQELVAGESDCGQKQTIPGRQGSTKKDADAQQGEEEADHLHATAGPSFSKKQFTDAVRRVQQYIAAGDIFQVNLSVRQTQPLENDHQPWHIYKVLRKLNPSPYMGYIHAPERAIVCGSPEQLIKVRGNKINTRPIAGTRPRGGNRKEDIRLAKELMKHEKERAEHIMLVDLERNDIGKVSRYGSVEVNELMVLEEYSHVMHIVSNVRGELADGHDAFDVIRAVFPGGTITGAPKVRTVEIIEELEPVRRGLYTGSIGWIDYNGDMELNIVIRTLLAQDGLAHVQAGAGIVIDSVPEKEYEESLNKAKALWKAFELSKQNEVVLS